MSMDEDDGMIPLYKPTSRAPLPIDVSILKRKNPEGSNGLQHFDNDGEELIIDDELLDEDDLKYSVQEEDYTNNEARSKRQKVQESTVREMVAENALRRKKRAGHKLTRDEKRLAVVLRRQSLTNSDQMARYANDEDSLISIPVVSPFRSFVEETLGPERPRTQCFGCTKGVGRAGTTGRAIAGLERMIKETISTQDVWTACVMISEHYELEIRQPANANRSKQEAELLEWSERSVYDHLTKHTLEPSFVLFTTIMELRTHLQIINSSGMYRVPKEIYASNRDIRLDDLIIDDKRHKQYLEATKMLVQLMNQKPDRMMFSNSNFNINSVPQHIIVPKSNAREVVRTKSIFDRTDLTEKSNYSDI